MAIVDISIDTSKQEVKVTADGKKIENVRDVIIYTALSGYFGVDIAMVEEVGEDLRKVSRLVASADPDKIPKGAKESVEFKGLLAVSEEAKGYTSRDILDALGYN